MKNTPPIQFVKNYDDLSSDRGYQFKFHCDLCGNGFMSSYKASKLALGAQVFRLISDFIGGSASRVAGSSYEIERMVGGKAHDSALQEAVEEIKPRFKQCTRCGKWVCPEVCWNPEKGLCKECAPDLRKETAAAQAQAASEQIHEKARNTDYVADVDMKSDAVAQCPSCGATVGAAKFCPECGSAVSPKAKCKKCGAKMNASAKFCPECGEKNVSDL